VASSAKHPVNATAILLTQLDTEEMLNGTILKRVDDCTAYHHAASRATGQLDERQRDSIKDEHRPYNAADAPS
jgi:hypothetical protein